MVAVTVTNKILRTGQRRVKISNTSCQFVSRLRRSETQHHTAILSLKYKKANANKDPTFQRTPRLGYGCVTAPGHQRLGPCHSTRTQAAWAVSQHQDNSGLGRVTAPGNQRLGPCHSTRTPAGWAVSQHLDNSGLGRVIAPGHQRLGPCHSTMTPAGWAVSQHLDTSGLGRVI